MASDDMTIGVLLEIRDEIRGLNTRLTDEVRGLNTRLTDEVRGLNTKLTDEIRGVRSEVAAQGARIDQTNARLDRFADRVVESEIRTATAINDVGATLIDVKGLLRDRLDLRDRVDQCERDIAELKHRAH